MLFIPPHLAADVADKAEATATRDRFGKGRIAAGIYTSGEIDVGLARRHRGRFPELAQGTEEMMAPKPEDNVRTASRPSELKITDLRTATVGWNGWRFAIVRIDTNQGI